MFGVYSVPAECMAYTGVFQSVKIESLICIVIGVIIGALYHKINNR